MLTKSQDLTKMKELLNNKITARRIRKESKREARRTARASKKRDFIIERQEKAALSTNRIRTTIAEKREQFEDQYQHLINAHQEQLLNLQNNHERQERSEKILIELANRHLQAF